MPEIRVVTKSLSFLLQFQGIHFDPVNSGFAGTLSIEEQVLSIRRNRRTGLVPGRIDRGSEVARLAPSAVLKHTDVKIVLSLPPRAVARKNDVTLVRCYADTVLSLRRIDDRAEVPGVVILA